MMVHKTTHEKKHVTHTHVKKKRVEARLVLEGIKEVLSICHQPVLRFLIPILSKVCMYVCVCVVCVCVCVCMYVCECMCVCVLCVCVRMFIYGCVCCVCVSPCFVRVYVCACVCMCMN